MKKLLLIIILSVGITQITTAQHITLSVVHTNTKERLIGLPSTYTLQQFARIHHGETYYIVLVDKKTGTKRLFYGDHHHIVETKILTITDGGANFVTGFGTLHFPAENPCLMFDGKVCKKLDYIGNTHSASTKKVDDTSPLLLARGVLYTLTFYVN